MGDYLARLKSGIALVGVATVFALVAFCFLAFALYFALLDVTTQAAAAGITGGIATVIAVIAFLVARSVMQGPAPKPRAAGAAPSNASGDPEFAAQIGQLLGDEAAGWTRTHPYGAVGIALAAGFAVGMSPELRRTLRGLLR